MAGVASAPIGKRHPPHSGFYNTAEKKTLLLNEKCARLTFDPRRWFAWRRSSSAAHARHRRPNSCAHRHDGKKYDEIRIFVAAVIGSPHNFEKEFTHVDC